MAFSISISSVLTPSGQIEPKKAIESKEQYDKTMKEIDRQTQSDLKAKRKLRLGYETNAKGTQIKVTDVYKSFSFVNDDGTKTVVRKNLTANVALILTFHDYTYVKSAAPRFDIDGDEKLTREGVEGLGRKLHDAAAGKEEFLLFFTNQELRKICRAERRSKIPQERENERLRLEILRNFSNSNWRNKSKDLDDSKE